MKLYVWNNPVSIAWGGSIIYAIAGSLADAKAQAKSAIRAEYGTLWRDETRLALKDIGEPDRVIDAPYAEYYEWSE